jgi:hypothetical protein
VPRNACSWRNPRLQRKTAFSRFPLVPRTDPEGQLRVDSRLSTRDNHMLSYGLGNPVGTRGLPGGRCRDRNCAPLLGERPNLDNAYRRRRSRPLCLPTAPWPRRSRAGFDPPLGAMFPTGTKEVPVRGFDPPLGAMFPTGTKEVPVRGFDPPLGAMFPTGTNEVPVRGFDPRPGSDASNRYQGGTG